MDKYCHNILLALLVLALAGVYIGISIPVIALAVGGLGIIGYSVLFRRDALKLLFTHDLKHFIRAPLFWLALLTLSSFGVSSFFGIRPDESLSDWMTICVVAFAGFVWYLGLRRLPESIATTWPRYVFIGLVITSICYLSEALIWKFTGHSLHSDRFFLTMRKLSAIYAILVPFALVYILRRNDIWGWAGLVLFATVVFFCGGRSGIVAFTIMALTFAFFFPWGRVAHWGRSLLAYVLTLGGGALIGTAGYMMMVGQDYFVNRIASPRAASGSGRINIWQFTWDQALEHPLWGIGVQAFRYLDFSDVKLSSTSHPHNIVLELLLETGFIGTGLLALFVIMLFIKTLWPAQRRILTDRHGFRPVIMAASVAFLSYLIAGQFMTSFFHGWWLTYPTLLAALLGALVTIYRRAEHTAFTDAKAKDFPLAVSVIMPCHNGQAFLAEAIESVRGQSFTDWELLIIDDGSHDNSWALIENFVAQDKRIKAFRHKTAQGAGAARNTGLEQARGRMVAFLDCDDLWTPDKLARQLAAMAENDAALSATHYDVIDDDGVITGAVTPRAKAIGYQSLLKINNIGCSTAMLDRAYLGDDLRFPSYERGQDFIFWCQILRQGHFCLCIREKLALYRVHKNSRTANKLQTARNRLRLLKEALGVPLILRPYYMGFHALFGVWKLLRSSNKAIIKP